MIQVIERGMHLLEALAQDPSRVWSVSELAEKLGVPSNTCFYLIQSFVELGYAESLGKRRGYRLGPGLNKLSRNPLYRPELLQAAEPFIRDYSREVGEFISLSIRAGTKRYQLCCALEDANITQQINYDVVCIDDLVHTISGRMLMAHAPEEEQLEILKVCGLPNRPSLWENARTEKEVLQVLRQTRGKSMLEANFLQDHMVVFPLFEARSEELAAVIGSYAPAYRLTAEHHRQMLHGLYKAARGIQQVLELLPHPGEGK